LKNGSTESLDGFLLMGESLKKTLICLKMIELLNFISENNFVRYKDGKWYRTGDIPRRFYTSEELVKLFEKVSLEDKIS
jgi:hypothetical protein